MDILSIIMRERLKELISNKKEFLIDKGVCSQMV